VINLTHTLCRLILKFSATFAKLMTSPASAETAMVQKQPRHRLRRLQHDDTRRHIKEQLHKVTIILALDSGQRRTPDSPMPGTARMTAQPQRRLHFKLTSITVNCKSITGNCLIAIITLLIPNGPPQYHGNRIRRPHYAINSHQSTSRAPGRRPNGGMTKALERMNLPRHDARHLTNAKCNVPSS
jgi:hypothetical protein